MPIDPLWALELGPVRVNAVSAGVTFVVGAVLIWLQRAVRRRIEAWRARRDDERRADHATLGSGWYFDDLVGASREFLVCVRAAPSKILAAPVRLDVERIAPFVRSAFGGRFPSFPEVSLPTETVRFRRKDVGQSRVDQFVVVWASGLIEATVPITPSVTVGGHEILPGGGHEPARWWPAGLPGGGRVICPR